MRQTGVNVQIRDTIRLPHTIQAEQEPQANNEHAEIENEPHENQNQENNQYMNLRPRREIRPPSYWKDYIKHKP